MKAAIIAGIICLTSLIGGRRAVGAQIVGRDSARPSSKELIAAVMSGDLVKTQQLVEQWRASGKPFPIGPDNKPLLFLAIEGREKSHPEIVELLLANGADVQTHVAAGISVAGIAAKPQSETKWSSGHYNGVKELLAARGVKAPRRPPPILAIFFGLMMALFFVAFMSGIFFLDARMTGWAALAQRFPAANEPANVNRHQNGGVGAIGLVQMRNLLRAAATDAGLYLAFPKVLSAGHRPLLIPWSQLRIADDKTVFGIRVLTLQAGDPKVARVILRGGIAQDVGKHF